MKPRDPHRFRQADRLFEAALDLPAAERDGFLARECGSDPELRREVERLLRAHVDSLDFLETPALDLGAPLLEGSDRLGSANVPDRLGPFRVVRTVGHGGMGDVYLGERADGQFEQRVALKLVRSAAAGPELRRRFVEERRIQARLEHAGIARVLDGGVTRDGRPWIAMEYVEGEPIDRYCDALCLLVRARVELFVAVCDAVDHAHRHLVVHRDLKPSNILITRDGQPKLLDFGIAKLLED
ncbi:MAG TPA: serine/threonine-protein kinase, partial [Longimicrobiales bacterium]|nr:serine/threonine-protein kinase [Longimicrobiales bacterium]